MHRSIFLHCLLLLSALIAGLDVAEARAADDASIRGAVVDPLGARVAGATVTLLRDGQVVKDTTSDGQGGFAFDGLPEGRYQIQATAAGFQERTTTALFVGAGARTTVDVTLSVGRIEADVTVTAAATPLVEAQSGAPVTVLDASTIDGLGNTDVLEPLRTVPGADVVQTGGRGGTTSLFVRGGASNFNKILVDGVPANDIGGGFDFADLATTGIDRVEVLRGSNSVIYGSDAMTGVVNLTTRRGHSRIPELMASVDGGNLSTSHADVSVGGAMRRVDYFGDVSHLQTDNGLPNNAYRNTTAVGRFGVMLGTNTDLSGTVRWIDSRYESPNAIDYFGIADDSFQTRRTTYASVSAQSQITDRWQSTIRFGVADQASHNENPAPTGTPSDASPFANFLGNVVTITGANGYSVTGRAILDFSGTYPSPFDSTVTRRLLFGQTSYHVGSALDLSGGARVENEHGTSLFAESLTETTRTNFGAFGEARASAMGRLFVTAGLGFDHNEIFGNAASPRVSVAAYLRQPSASDPLGDTKVTFNAGKGIKEPNLSQELSSLFALVPPATASSLGVDPVGPEKSRTLDVGLEQGLARGRGRVRVAYFNNTFDDLIEFLSKSALVQIGVPPAAANATAFGAYVNAQSNDARGVEMSGEAVAGPIRLTASYMYLDAVVTKSFSSGALSPAINPAFPGIPIGSFSPLVGARPFRRPTNSGSLTVTYSKARAQLAVAGYFFGKQDDSTFLTDANFGNSMLLPNKDLDAAYQKFDLSASYQIHPRLRWYLTVENLFDQTFEAAAGFPALPRAARTGVTINVGGR
ncbi:MAG TPA: TonB-dependent receptor, partial [Vicinamibacterales bacterium]|nr:TonB-dependent receptor [Vicinamibacterales bacterium]